MLVALKTVKSVPSVVKIIFLNTKSLFINTYTRIYTRFLTSVGGLGLENGNSWCFGGNNYIVQNENVHGRKRIIIRHVKDWEPE